MKSKKIISLALGLTMGTAMMFPVAACQKKNDPNTLYIELNNAGYGVEWIDPIIDIFEEEHPDITVEKTYITKGSGTIIDKVDSGATHLDLVFIEKNYKDRMKAVTAKDGTTYSIGFADLTDIYNEKVPGEDVLLKNKMLEGN